jgi:AraC-like DNA-binding protein/CheY-like chemotaxis protein
MERNPALILIVEDELLIASDIRRILSKEGYNSIINITGYDEAIREIENQKPALVMIDVMLRKTRDGIKIGEYLHSKGSIPFLYMTSLSDKNTINDIKKTFPFGYIVKPYKATDIIANVELALHSFKYKKIDINRITSPAIKDETPYHITKVIRYINDNILEKIYLQDLIDLTPWKKHRFIDIFKEYTDATPHQYIIHCKMEKCMALFDKSELTLKDISYELGFSSYSSFSKLFKEKFGVNAEEYRRMNSLKY